jgi:hypothetical protein
MVTGVMPFLNRAVKQDPLYQYIYRNDEKSYWEALSKTYLGKPEVSMNLSFSEEFKKFIWQFFFGIKSI